MLNIDNDLLLKIVLTLLCAVLFFFLISTVAKPPKVVESSFSTLVLIFPIGFAFSRRKKGLTIPPEVLITVVILVPGI